MIEQERKVRGFSSMWKKPWTIYISKLTIIFFGGMFVLLVYVFFFST